MATDSRGEARREAQFYAREDRCASCGRVLTNRKKGWGLLPVVPGKLEGQPAEQ